MLQLIISYDVLSLLNISSLGISVSALVFLFVVSKIKRRRYWDKSLFID